VYRLGPLDYAPDALLTQALASLHVAEMGEGGGAAVSSWRAQPLVHTYAYVEEEEQQLGGVDFALDEEDGGTAFTSQACPCKEFEGLWESIHVSAHIKEVLLAMAATSVLFAACGVNPHLVSGNRVILLFGPPGTGKSTLARGLAQKLAIRHSAEAFAGGVELLSVNAHALISKFFGESSTNVGRVFGHIRERVAEEPGSLFVCVIDEIETVVSSRENALAKGSNEPSDAVRVVNAVLTELDRLRSFKNVLLLCTSNITTALDSAFLDRCDLRIQVGLPNAEGRFQILRSALYELVRAGVVGPHVHIPPRYDLLLHAPQHASLARLVELTGLGGQGGAGDGGAGGMSGRSLRKLPLQAYALLGATRSPPVPLLEFLAAMERAVEGMLEVRAEAGNGVGNGLGGQRL
jgi:pachytene checkpoint protein 2